TNYGSADSAEKINCDKAYQVLANEIEKENAYWDDIAKKQKLNVAFVCDGCIEAFRKKEYSSEIYDRAKSYFEILKLNYRVQVDSSRAKIDRKTTEIIDKNGKEEYLRFVED